MQEQGTEKNRQEMSSTNGVDTHHRKELTPDEIKKRTKELRVANRYKAEQLQATLLESLIPYADSHGFGGSDSYEQFWLARNTGGGGYAPPAMASDRRGGAKWPMWRTDLELNRLRQDSRIVFASNAYAKGLVKNLTNYVIGKGMGYKSTPKKNEKAKQFQGIEQLTAGVDNVMSHFCARNGWNASAGPNDVDEDGGVASSSSTKERESYWRVLRDGEVFIRLFYRDDGNVDVRFVSPELIWGMPPGETQADGWSYGIKHRVTEEGEDQERIDAYYVRNRDVTHQPIDGRDNLGGEIVPASEMIHIKDSWEDAEVKRGTPALSYDTLDALLRASKLQRNISVSAAVRAATAEVWKHSVGSQAQIQSLENSRPGARQVGNIDGITQRTEQLIYPGMIRRTPQGQEPVPFPSTTNVPEHQQAAQGDLRQACAGFSAPEYMTGTTNEANFATASESGAPFVRSSESEQEHFKVGFTRLMWRVIRHAVKCQRLPQEALELVTITAEAQEVKKNNDGELAQVRSANLQNKITSPQIEIMRIGNDPVQVIDDWKKWEAEMGGGQQPGGMMPGAGPDGGGDDPDGGDGAPQGGGGHPLDGVPKEELSKDVQESAQQGSLFGNDPGFTGEIKDKLGRKVKFQDGKRIAGQHDEPAKKGSAKPSAKLGKEAVEIVSHDPQRGLVKVRGKSGEETVVHAHELDFGGGKAQPGERAGAANASYHELMAKAKAARIDAFAQVKADAIKARDAVQKHVDKMTWALNSELYWDSDNDEPFNDLDTEIVYRADDTAPVKERYESFKAIEEMATEALKHEQATEKTDDDEQMAFTPQEISKNKATLKLIAQHAREARKHLKAFVQFRKEMQAIKEGSTGDVREALEMMDVGFGVDLLEGEWDENKHPRDHGKFASKEEGSSVAKGYDVEPDDSRVNTHGRDEVLKALDMKGHRGIKVASINYPPPPGSGIGNVASALAYRESDDQPDWFFIEHIGSWHRGTGAGTELLRRLVNKAAKNGNGLHFVSSPESIPYYERLGFEHLSERNPEEMGASNELIRRIARKLNAKKKMSEVRESAEPVIHDTEDLAHFYAETWGSMTPEQIGEEEIATVNDELAGGDYSLSWDDEAGKWVVTEGVGGVLLEAVRHSPKGGVTINGKKFKGGMFIPSADYEKATPEEKKKIDEPAKAASDKRKARGSVDADKVRSKIKDKHGHHELTAAEKTSAKRSLNALIAHHGELTVHRLEEIADSLHAAYDKTPEDEEGQRTQFSRRLKAIEHMLDMAKEPWEMTKDEMKARIEPAPIDSKAGYNTKGVYFVDSEGNKAYYPSKETAIRRIHQMHRESVDDAIAAGKPVPAEVLADYPDLQGKKEPAKAEPASQFGKEGDGHPLAGLSPEQKRKKVAELNLKANDDGVADVEGVAKAGPPKGLDMKAFGADLVQAVNAHVEEHGVGDTLPKFYETVGKKHGLSKFDFLRAVHKEYEDGNIRLGGWHGTLHEIPDPDLFYHVSGKGMYYIHGATGRDVGKTAETHNPPSASTTPVEPKQPDPVTESTGTQAGVPDVSPDVDPREVADKAKKSLDADYEFARSSDIPNLGEDLKGSARHKVNAWKSLQDAENDGTAEEMVTRVNLLKNEPHNLMANVTPGNALSSLAAHFAINAFPSTPYDADSLKSYQKVGDVPPDQLRKQYYDAYQVVKSEAERLAQTESDPRKVADHLRSVVGEIIGNIRKAMVKNQYGTPVSDRFNPVANALCDLHKRLGTFRAKSTYVMGRVEDFAGRLKKAYGETPSVDMLEKAAEHVKDVMEGESFNKTFGTVEGGKKGFDAAAMYVKHAMRKGGREVNAETVKAGSEFVMNNLKMRGLQWGNSVTDDEREHHLQKSSEAFADLADVVGFPDDAMSLQGVLGLAIGARGKGTASAHYEPGTKVINLTRKNGVGTLAHEWGHALDHYLTGGGVSSAGGDYMSNRTSQLRFRKNPDGSWATTDGRSMATEDFSNDPIWSGMDGVRKAMKETGFDKRLSSNLRLAVEQGVISKSKANDYWNSNHEKFARTFERYVQHKLRQSDRDNTYLAGLSDNDTYGLWPNDEEIAKIAPAMDSLLAAVKTKHFTG